MLTGLVVRYLGSKAAKAIILKLLEIYVKKTDNKLDDEILKAIKELLDNGDI